MRPTLCLTLLALAAAAAAHAASAKAGSLCAAGEKVAFTCPAGAHVLSVCELPGGQALQYRLGKPGQVALAYPAPGTPAAKAFKAGLLAYSGGGGAYLDFTRGGYSYTVFTAIGRWGKDGAAYTVAGVAVAQGGAAVANISCDHHNFETSALGPDLFEQYHIATADPGEADFFIPDAFIPN